MTEGDVPIATVARIFGVQEARLRYWAQTGFVGPSARRGGRMVYTFQDLLAVKVACDLLDGGLPLQRVRKSLDALRAALPDVRQPLAELRVSVLGDDVVVVGDERSFVPRTGQLLLSFSARVLTDRLAEVVSIAPPAETAAPKPTTAWAAFQNALAAQDAGELSRAEGLYRHATKLDPGLAAAWTNLGALLLRRGARGEARTAFETALARDPDQPEARYDLALLYADLGERERAIAELRRVVAGTPEMADAHYNLGVLCAELGQAGAARRHLETYLELDDASEWAAQARAALAALG